MGGPPDGGPAEPLPDLGPKPFTFTGSGAEYFRIWIVNVMLSVATLGLYSGRAKARQLRYFYARTIVDGTGFGYHGSPLALLKGRLVGGVVALVLYVTWAASLLANLAIYLPVLVAMPLLLVRASKFRAVNASYRGIRFGFDGTVPGAYLVFLFWPITAIVTLGLAYPYVATRQREFHVNESRLGKARFRTVIPRGLVYGIYLTAAFCVVFTIMVLSLVLGVGRTPGLIDMGDEMRDALAWVQVAVFNLALVGVAGGVRTAFENLVWNHTTLDGHVFRSDLRVSRVLWLYATNAVMIMATLGLFVPWARVRLARYRASCVTLWPMGPLRWEAFDGGATHGLPASEVGEAMGLDLGL